jgi:putative MFS transporter
MSIHRDINQEANLVSRMERMPLNKSLYGIVSILTLCWVIEAFDVGLIGQVVAVLKSIWTLSPGEIGLLGSCSTAGVVIGTASAGFLTDKFGRKRILLWGTFIFTFFTLIGAVFPNLEWIVAMRFISGLGAGAVFPQPYLMISEIAPAKHRGKLVSVSNAILTFAFMLPTVIGAWAINNFALETAWRAPFIVGGLPIFTVILIHKWMPESPRWLMLRGRYEEVRAMVVRFEKSSGLDHNDAYINPLVLANLERVEEQEKARGKASWNMLFRPPYLSRSLISWGLYSVGLICWYVIMVYLPSIISSYGLELSTSVGLVGVLITIAGVGNLTIGPLADRFGRKPIIAIYIGITVVCLFMLPKLESNLLMMLIVGAMTAFFSIAANAIFKVYIAEQYPTELRGVGTGFGEAVGRFVGGVLATYYLAFFLAAAGVTGVFYFLAVAYMVVVICMLIWGRETAGRSVEETSSISRI